MKVYLCWYKSWFWFNIWSKHKKLFFFDGDGSKEENTHELSELFQPVENHTPHMEEMF